MWPRFFFLLAALLIFTSAGIIVADRNSSEFQPEAGKPKGVEQKVQYEQSKDVVAVQKSKCGFPDLRLPPDFAVFLVGAYSGRKLPFQIDQSGNEGTQIDVVVNSPDKPVVLVLAAYDPTIWNIGWSMGTKILAVFASGYHRQAVAGLEKSVLQLNSSYENPGPCGYFYYVKGDKVAPFAKSSITRRVFGKDIEMFFHAENGRVVVGESLQPGTQLVTSPEVTPESFYDPNALIAGLIGVEEAVRTGFLRRATEADADAWVNAFMFERGILKLSRPFFNDAYVVMKSFTYPAGLYGRNMTIFFIPKGIPQPDGNPGHSTVYDFNTLKCQGPLCYDR